MNKTAEVFQPGQAVKIANHKGLLVEGHVLEAQEPVRNFEIKLENGDSIVVPVGELRRLPNSEGTIQAGEKALREVGGGCVRPVDIIEEKASTPIFTIQAKDPIDGFVYVAKDVSAHDMRPDTSRINMTTDEIGIALAVPNQATKLAPPPHALRTFGR